MMCHRFEEEVDFMFWVAQRRPWRRCSACRGVCHWHDTAWVCEGCGSEWVEDHSPRYAAPGDSDPTIPPLDDEGVAQK